MATKGSKRTKKKGACCSLVFIDSGRVLKRSLVMPLPKDTNLLDQVCWNIDWEEAERLPLCWLQQGAGLWNRITRGQAAGERMSITFWGLIQRGGPRIRDWDVEDQRGGKAPAPPHPHPHADLQLVNLYVSWLQTPWRLCFQPQKIFKGYRVFSFAKK